MFRSKINIKNTYNTNKVANVRKSESNSCDYDDKNSSVDPLPEPVLFGRVPFGQIEPYQVKRHPEVEGKGNVNH